MTIKNTKSQEKIKNPDELFIQEFFSSFDNSFRSSIQSILDLYQDKWSVRLILLSFYFLEEEANEISIKQVTNYAYGTSGTQGLVQKFHMENWSCFGGVKDEELVKFNKLITGSQHARNIPKSLCDEGLLMQQIGKNKRLTPLGLSVCQYLHFKFLKENRINLKILSDFYKNSNESFIIKEIPDSLPERLNQRDCVNMSVLTPIAESHFKLNKKILKLYEFILDHPYIDFRASQILKKEIIKTIRNSIIEKVGHHAGDSSLIKGIISSINVFYDINWIYKLDLRGYSAESEFKEWISSLSSSQGEKGFKGFILQSEPGTGKTIWMLQQSYDLFLGNYKEPFSEELLNDDLKLIPFFLPLKNFAIREVNDKYEIFYLENRLIEIKDQKKDPQYLRKFWSKLIGIVYKGRELELWGRAFLRLFDESNILILGDGWDELTPNLKGILTDLILATARITNIKLKYLISTRYLEKSLTPLIQEQHRKNNILRLEKPTKEQVLKYLEEREVQWITDDYRKDLIEKRFGSTLTPMNLWLLGLFPNFDNLPQNRAELYERWIKYEALREISDKLYKRFGKTFLATIRAIVNYKDLDLFLDEQLTRGIDGKKFPLMQYLEGPIPGIVESSKIKKPRDYGLLKLLPKLVYHRLSNPHYYENYHQIVQMNPLFNRFIRYYNDEKNRPNFVLINSHYDYYLAALHCFHNYREGFTFDFLEDVDRSKSLEPEMFEREIFESTSSSLIKSLFMEILDFTNERRENDIVGSVSNELILLRNVYERIPRFNDNGINYPLNQHGPFIFKLKIKNFIDPHLKQVYKYYWNRYIEQKGELPKGEDLIRFQCINNSLVNNEERLRQFFINILNFQGQYVSSSVKLNEIFDKIDIEIPNLIPILIYTYDINQTDNLSEKQIKSIKDSEFIKLPWVKLWLNRGIIRHHPERIKELSTYALEHSYSYLLNYCALNIIWTLNKEIEEEIFDISLKLFRRVSNRYKEIIIFQWASHLLTNLQLMKIKKLKQNYHYGKKISHKIIFDLHYLLILHKILPADLEYNLNFAEVPRKKALFFLIELFNSKLISEEKIGKIFLDRIPLKSVIYIHRILLNNIDVFSHEGIRQKITSEFTEFGLKSCERWWNKNTPYQQKDINTMLQEITHYFLNSGSYKENKEFENQKFRLKKYFENLNDLPESDKGYIFSDGRKLLKNLLKKEEKPTPKYSALSLTRAQDFFEVFYKWLIHWGNKDVLIEFYYEFKDYFDFDDFFFQANSRLKEEKLGELNSLMIEQIKKTPKKYFLSAFFDSLRKTHPEIVNKNSFLNDSDKFKLLKVIPEEQLYELLLDTFDITNNNDLFNYVYNLCNLGSDSDLKKVANLWDKYYVDVDKVGYNLRKNAYDDPSFYVWCGIPYELLDEIYPLLEKPIARIFYLVCLSIRDTFKPQELNEKHSINKENSKILLLLEDFSQNEWEEALIKFLSADWAINHFRFLFSIGNLTEKLIECMIEIIRSGRKSLSSILSIRYKDGIQGEETILSSFFKICPDLTINFCREVMSYYDQRDKVVLFSALKESNNIQALSLATDFWENYGNLVIELNELDIAEIKKRIFNTKNFHYIKKLKLGFRPEIRKINKIEDLIRLKGEIQELEKIIDIKRNDDSIQYFDKRSNDIFDGTFDYSLKEIKERKKELKAINLDLEDFLKFLNKSDEEGLRRIIHARFPSRFYHKSSKSIIWNKIDELNWITSQTLRHGKAKELIDIKIADYQRYKEEILKYPDRFDEDVDYFEFTKKEFFESPFLKKLIIKDVRITFNNLKNINNFLLELKTIKGRQRALFFILNSYFLSNGYLSPWETIEKKNYKHFKEELIVAFKDYLTMLDMEEIFEYFDSKIKMKEDSSYSNSFGDNYYDKEYYAKLDKTKDSIYSELLNETMNISRIEENLENIGDGYEFKQFIFLIIEKDEQNFYFGRDQRIYEKISSNNLKILHKYLFYWILKQRQRYQHKLSHDSTMVADESNEVSEVDQGISVDNLFEEVYINSINNGYFTDALNYLKEIPYKNWYKIIKNYTLFQLEPGIKNISRSEDEFRSRLKIPINQTIIDAFEGDEIKWSLFLYSATKFYNVVNIQLFDLPQFLNGFKLRKTTRHTGYNDDFLEF